MIIKKLSIIVPAYNEEKTIEEILRASAASAASLAPEVEIIVVDDYSRDKTAERVEQLVSSLNGVSLNLIRQDRNHGKGAALKRGFLAATGDIVIVQDADLEYDPRDYPVLLKPFLDDHTKADVVYGSRFRGEIRKVGYFWNSLGNKFLTAFSNILMGLNLTDMETGYKAFRREVLQRIAPTLESQRFDIEPEITAKVAKGKWRLFEVPISYTGRTYEEGKKIGWRDGLRAVGVIVYFRFFD